MEYIWKRIRDEETTEVYYACWDPIAMDIVATVRKVGKGRKAWQCAYRGRVPFHRSSAKKCRSDYEYIATNTFDKVAL